MVERGQARACRAAVWVVTGALVVALGVGGMARPLAAARDGADALEVIATGDGASTSERIVVVPRELRGRVVPGAAFSASAAGDPIRVRTVRLEPASIDLTFVVASGGSAERDAGVRAAIVEGAVALPEGARVAVVAGSTPTVRVDLVAGADGARAASAALVAADLGDDLAGGVAVARAEPAAGRHPVVVAIGPEGAPVVAASRPSNVPIYVVHIGSSAPASSMRNGSGGLTFVRGDDAPVDALDAVIEDLLGRYRVVMDAPAGATRVVLTVRHAGVEAEAEVVLNPTGAAATGAGGSGAVAPDGSPAVSGVAAPPSDPEPAAGAPGWSPGRPLVAIGLVVATAGAAAALARQAARRRAAARPAAGDAATPAAASDEDLLDEGLRGPGPAISVLLVDPARPMPSQGLLPAGAVTVVHDAVDALRAAVRLRADTIVLAPGAPSAAELVEAVARHDRASGRTTRLLVVSDDGATIDLRDPTGEVPARSVR